MFPGPGAGLCSPFATAVASEANLSFSVLVFVFPVFCEGRVWTLSK